MRVVYRGGMHELEQAIREFARQHPGIQGKAEEALAVAKTTIENISQSGLSWNQRVELLQEFKRKLGICAGIHPWR